MKTRVMILNHNDLTSYLRENWKGPHSKQYELLAAYYLAKIISYKQRKTYVVAFPILENTGKEIGYQFSQDRARKIIESYLDENTHIDFLLVPEETMVLKPDGMTGIAKGESFQIKKIVARGNDATSSTINYLKNSIPREYGKTDASLLLLIQKPYFEGELDLDLLKSSLNFKSYPFVKILIFGGSGDMTFYGELWPNFGYDKYDRDQFHKITSAAF